MRRGRVVPFTPARRGRPSKLPGVLRGWLLPLVGAIVVGIAAGVFAGVQLAPRDCSVAMIERVIDGDTIVITVGGASDRLRLLGVDTPELGAGARCAAEQAGAARARDRLRALIAAAADRQICPDGRDKYGRILAKLLLDDTDAAEILIRERLGRPYFGGRRTSWCG